MQWRESGATVLTINENFETGRIDLMDLEKKILHFKNRKLKIGSFSICSNLTGVVENTNEVAALLHRHGCLSFWDCATGSPYLDINMNPVVEGEDGPFVYKDAVFISGHKFIGGPGSPGVLVAKKKLFTNPVPTHVCFVEPIILKIGRWRNCVLCDWWNTRIFEGY